MTTVISLALPLAHATAPADAAAGGSAAAPSATANTARDPDIAVREEFEHLKSRNSIEALDLFIRRHPDHPLASEARGLIEAKKQVLKQQQD